MVPDAHELGNDTGQSETDVTTYMFSRATVEHRMATPSATRKTTCLLRSLRRSLHLRYRCDDDDASVPQYRYPEEERT